MRKSCYYCGFKTEEQVRVCPKCHTITRWQTKEQCIEEAIFAEKRRWENGT